MNWTETEVEPREVKFEREQYIRLFPGKRKQKKHQDLQKELTTFIDS